VAVPASCTRAAADFPLLGSAVDQRICAQTPAFTVSGALLGDACLASADYDGGFTLPPEVTMSCDVTAADSAKVRLCSRFVDGGTFDVGDAGYFARTFR